jgi:hypothetical protein
VAIASLLASCSAGNSLVAQKLDYVTGVTVTRSTAPVVLYRDNSAYAAHARDYVYLGPVEVNRMGSNSYYLWLGIWSTMRDEGRSAERDGFESVILYVDGEPLPLDLAGWTLDAIGVSEPVYVKPVASAADAYYSVTVDQIRLIAESSEIQLRVSTAQPKSYSLWDKQGAANASMRAFVYGDHD